MIPGYKSFFETPCYGARVARVNCENCQDAANHSNPSGHSTTPEKKQHDPDAVLERASIMEFDAGLSRPQANQAAARDLDQRRPLTSDPDAAQKYRIYITSWQPTDGDDLPDVPPHTLSNSELWSLWWERVEREAK